MKLQLIDGAFSPTETMDILTQLFYVKIKFHEEKVKNSANEEDIIASYKGISVFGLLYNIEANE